MDRVAKPEGGPGVGGTGLMKGNEDERVWAEKSAADVMEIEGGADSFPDEGTLTFPGPISQACYFDDGEIVGIVGPVGSGKTETVLRSRVRRARMAPRSTIDGVRRYKLLIVRETYRQLWSTTIPSYLGVYPKNYGVWSGGRGDPVTHRLGAKVPGEDRYVIEDEFGEIEMTVEFMAFGDDIIAAMRGTQFTDIYCNELDTMPEEILVTGAGRIGRFPGERHFVGYDRETASWAQIICDFNAPDEDSWVYRLFYDPAARKAFEDAVSGGGAGRAISLNFYNQPGYGQPGAENLQNLPANYYETQIALNRAMGRGDMTERMVYNRPTYLRIGEPVFKREYKRRIHVSEGPMPPEAGAKLRIGLDQGFVPAAVIATFEPPFFWRVHAELMFPKERLLADVFADRLLALLAERFPDHEVEGAWGDMAGEAGSSLAEDENLTWNKIIQDVCGFRVRPQRIGANRIQPRLEAIRAALEYLEGGEPGYMMDPSCTFLRSGFEARYVWADVKDKSGSKGQNPDKTGDKRKTPDKSVVEANAMDALQYLLLSEVRQDGRNPISGLRHPGQAGPRGRPPPKPSGLRVGHNILNPYPGAGS